MKSYDIESRMRQIVFQRTRSWLADGRRLSYLANQAGVTTNTVSRLAYGETKFPRFHTVIAVCDALGVKLVIEDTASVAAVPTVGKANG